ncbi:MAG: response regulator transcription factor [Chloroflexota bacterium]
MIRVSVDVSSPVIAAGLRAIVSDDPGLHLLDGDGEPDDEQHQVDVVLVTRLPRSGDRVTLAPRAYVVLAEYRVDWPARDELPARGVAFVAGGADSDSIRAAIRAAHAGFIAFSPSVLDHEQAQRGALTERERQVLSQVARGLPNKHIARRLGITEHTVKFHMASILAKLDARSRAEAVHTAMREGIISV